MIGWILREFKSTMWKHVSVTCLYFTRGRSFREIALRIFLQRNFDDHAEKEKRPKSKVVCTRALARTDFNVIDILNMDSSISYLHRRKTRIEWRGRTEFGALGKVSARETSMEHRGNHQTTIIRVYTDQTILRKFYVFKDLSSSFSSQLRCDNQTS